MDNNTPNGLIGLAVVAVIGFMLFMGSFFVVSPGDVAVKTRMGKLVGSYGEGPHLKVPFLEGISKFSIQIERTDIKTEAFSKDLQQMTCDLAVNHRIQQNTIESVYRNLGPNYVNNILNPMVQEILKAITAKYSAEEVIANRMAVVKELNEVAKAKLLEKEIIITDISIVDLSFRDDFMKAVEAKQIAEQQAKQAEKLVAKAKQEADQMIATARGQAEALKLQREQITPMMLESKRLDITREAVAKWGGGVPQYMGGNMPVPFIDAAMMKGK
jgi:regulator of protease activity HflC (stomatin/prohibitin superfamily)